MYTVPPPPGYTCPRTCTENTEYFLHPIMGNDSVILHNSKMEKENAKTLILKDSNIWSILTYPNTKRTYEQQQNGLLN